MLAPASLLCERFHGGSFALYWNDAVLENLSVQTHCRIPHGKCFEEETWRGCADAKCSNWLALPRLAELAALQPMATLYGNVLKPRARSYYACPIFFATSGL